MDRDNNTIEKGFPWGTPASGCDLPPRPAAVGVGCSSRNAGAARPVRRISGAPARRGPSGRRGPLSAADAEENAARSRFTQGKLRH